MSDWPFDQISRTQADLISRCSVIGIDHFYDHVRLRCIDSDGLYEYVNWKSFPQHVVLNHNPGSGQHPTMSLLLLSPEVKTYLESET